MAKLLPKVALAWTGDEVLLVSCCHIYFMVLIICTCPVFESCVILVLIFIIPYLSIYFTELATLKPFCLPPFELATR